MPVIKLADGNSIALPAHMARVLGVKPGDRLRVEARGDHIRIKPEPKLNSATESEAAAMPRSEFFDVFENGKRSPSSKEEIDRRIAELRHGYEIDGLKNALKGDPDMRAVYDATSFDEIRSLKSIVNRSGVKDAQSKLITLCEVDAVKQMSAREDFSQPYYRRMPCYD